MHAFTRNGKQTLDLLAVDNIQLGANGQAIFAAVDQGLLSAEEARERIKARARAYGAKSENAKVVQVRKVK